MGNYVFDGIYGPIPNNDGTVDLSNYAENYIKNYESITELPKENEEYLNEVFTNPNYKVTNMEFMFRMCWKLKTINLSDWYTGYVTSMEGLFSYCESLTSLSVYKWDTSSVTNMSRVFSCCANLKTIDLSGWDTSKVTNMNCMFAHCRNISSVVGIFDFDTSHVTDMDGLFADCFSINNLILTNWDTKNVKTANWMFMNCVSLMYIYDLTLDLSNCYKFESMLSSTPISIIDIKLPDGISEEEFKEFAFKQNKAIINFIK